MLSDLNICSCEFLEICKYLHQVWSFTYRNYYLLIFCLAKHRGKHLKSTKQLTNVGPDKSGPFAYSNNTTHHKLRSTAVV